MNTDDLRDNEIKEQNNTVETNENKSDEYKRAEFIKKRDKIVSTINILILVVSIVFLSIILVLIIPTMKMAMVFTENKDIASDEFSEYFKEFEQIKAVYDTYSIVEDIDYSKAMENALFAFSASLGDKYGVYLSPETASNHIDGMLQQKFGVGIKFANEDDGLYVVKTYKNSPAERAGIKEADKIIKVNNVSFKDYEEIMKEFPNESGEKAVITLLRDGKTLEFKLEAEEVSMDTIDDYTIDGKVYLRINSFYTKTDDEFIELMDKYYKNGYKDFIIDLRNNSGGSLETVVRMIDYVVPNGLIVEIKGKVDEMNSEYYSDAKEFNGNIVILTNDGTASASELFTKTLKEYGKAKQVGEKTYGKGTVINEYKLSNNGIIVASVAKYYTKSGECIEGIGVEPDITVKMTTEQYKNLYKLKSSEDKQLIKAIELLNSMED